MSDLHINNNQHCSSNYRPLMALHVGQQLLNLLKPWRVTEYPCTEQGRYHSPSIHTHAHCSVELAVVPLLMLTVLNITPQTELQISKLWNNILQLPGVEPIQHKHSVHNVQMVHKSMQQPNWEMWGETVATQENLKDRPVMYNVIIKLC